MAVYGKEVGKSGGTIIYDNDAQEGLGGCTGISNVLFSLQDVYFIYERVDNMVRRLKDM